MHAAVFLAVALAAQATPQATQGGATEALKERDAEIRAALPPRGEPAPEVRKKVETTITRTVDLEGMLQAALGPRWREITEKQRRRLVAAFERRFRDLSGRELDTYRSTQREKAGWRIVDIAVDGVSTVQNYRSSFNRVIQKEGVEGLINRLEKGSAGKKPSASGAAKSP